MLLSPRDLEDYCRFGHTYQSNGMAFPSGFLLPETVPQAAAVPLEAKRQPHFITLSVTLGNLGRVQGIENLLRAIAGAKSESAAFCFAGDGVFRPAIEEFIRENPGKKVVHLGHFPLSSQQLFLNACDVAFVTLNDAMYGLGVPSKAYFSMAAAKPLLLVAGSESEIGRVVRESRVGWVVLPNYPDVLAKKIDEICQMSDLDEIGRRAREVVERRFSEQVILARYTRYFQELSGQRAAQKSRVEMAMDAA